MKLEELIEKAGTVVTYTELKSLGIPNIDQKLNYLVKRGTIIRLKKEFYVHKENFDPFLAAKYISNGYISFYTGLYIYKLVDAPAYTVYVATRDKSATHVIQNVEYKEVKVGRRFGDYVEGKYRVASKPKLIYECFRMPEYSGGYPTLYKALIQLKMKQDEWKKLIEYANQESKSFRQKIGYLLEKASAPDWVLDELRPKNMAKVYLDKQITGGKYIKSWSIIDPYFGVDEEWTYA